MDQAKKHIQNEIDKIDTQMNENKALLESADKEMVEMAKEEIKRLEERKNNYLATLEAMEGGSVSSDSDDPESSINPNVAVLEIRAGTGGDEAGLFARDLYNMYMRFADSKGWKKEPMFMSENEMGGVKTISIKLKGKNSYELLKNESGVHRVQRVPKTESSGRIHTSAATVAVLPELKKIHIEIKPEELKLDFFRSGGSGGQNVNKVSTAVRITHLPTNTVVECQEERTQGKNREKAMQVLEARLYTMMKEQKVAEITDLRSSQVGGGDRSEKIRTYNYPQDRVTDHRLGKNWHNIPALMNGDIESLLTEVSKIPEAEEEN